MGKNISRARIYLDCKELATFVFIATQDFPKGVKYTLGGEMHRAAILALRGIVAAYNFRDLARKRQALEDFQTNLDLLVGLLDIAISQRWLVRKNVREGVFALVESISKQSSGWKRSVIASSDGLSRQGQGQTESPCSSNT